MTIWDIEIWKTFSQTWNKETIPASTCNSVVRQRHQSVSLSQHQTVPLLLPSILVTAVLSCLSSPWHQATVLLHFSHASSQICHLSGRKLIFTVFPFAKFASLSSSPPHVVQRSIFFCYFATYFWGQSASHAIINSPHQALLASIFAAVWFPSHPFRFSHWHLSCWVSIDIPN